MGDNANVSDFLNLFDGFCGKNALRKGFSKSGLPFQFDLIANWGKFVYVFYKI